MSNIIFTGISKLQKDSLENLTEKAQTHGDEFPCRDKNNPSVFFLGPAKQYDETLTVPLIYR